MSTLPPLVHFYYFEKLCSEEEEREEQEAKRLILTERLKEDIEQEMTTWWSATSSSTSSTLPLSLHIEESRIVRDVSPRKMMMYMAFRLMQKPEQEQTGEEDQGEPKLKKTRID